MAADERGIMFDPFRTQDGPGRLDMMLAIFVEEGTAEHPRNLLSFSTIQQFQGGPVKFTLEGYLLGAERAGDHKNENFKYQFLILEGRFLGVDLTGRMLSGVHNVRDRRGQAWLGSLLTPTFKERGDETFATYDSEVPVSLSFLEESLAADGYQLATFERGDPQGSLKGDLVIARHDWNGKRQSFKLIWVEPTRKFHKNVGDMQRTFLPGTRFLVRPI